MRTDRLTFIKKHMKGKVLDVGCVQGPLHELIYREGVYGLDVRDDCSIKKNFFVGDAQKMPFKDNFFDTVIAGELIEHLESPDKFLSEANRVLKKDGILILSTPNRDSLYNRLTKKYIVEGTRHHRHETIFNKEMLKKILDKHGFRIKEFTIIAYDKISNWGTHHKTTLELRKLLCFFLPEELRENMLIVARKEVSKK